MTANLILTILIGINLFITFILFFQRSIFKSPVSDRINDLGKGLQRIEAGFREDFRINREENARIAKETELN